MKNITKTIKNNLKDIILIIAAIWVFDNQIRATEHSKLSDSIFSAFSFVLSLGIGWFLQRIASREEFNQNLRQFALSAYRRISDINKSVIRIKDKIEQMRFAKSASCRTVIPEHVAQ